MSDGTPAGRKPATPWRKAVPRPPGATAITTGTRAWHSRGGGGGAADTASRVHAARLRPPRRRLAAPLHHFGRPRPPDRDRRRRFRGWPRSRALRQAVPPGCPEHRRDRAISPSPRPIRIIPADLPGRSPDRDNRASRGRCAFKVRFVTQSASFQVGRPDGRPAGGACRRHLVDRPGFSDLLLRRAVRGPRRRNTPLGERLIPAISVSTSPDRRRQRRRQGNGRNVEIKRRRVTGGEMVPERASRPGDFGLQASWMATAFGPLPARSGSVSKVTR
jgi:hypothetical protein